MQTFKQKSPRTLRRVQERKLRKQYKNCVVIPANDSFSKIKPELLRMGWMFEDDFGNLVDLGNSSALTFSPAVRLVTEKFNVTIVPHKEGVEISRLEVWEKYQGKGYASLFLDNLLRFLMKKGVKDVYVLPLPAGIGKSRNSLAFSAPALQGFYQKRGFQKLANEWYWKLETGNSIDIRKLEVEILSKPTLSGKVAFRGIEIHIEFVNDDKKNLVFFNPYETKEELLEFLERYIKTTSSNIRYYVVSTYFVNLFLEAYKSGENTESQSNSVQKMFACFMAEIARDEHHFKQSLEVLGTAMIAVLQLGSEGLEDGIKAYRLLFDEQSHTMEITASTECDFNENLN